VYSDLGAQQSGLVMAKKVKKAPFDARAFLATVDGGRSLSRYRNEEAIFSQGDPADAVFYIQKGQVKLTVVSEQGKEAVVALSGPDEFFGEGCEWRSGQIPNTATGVGLGEDWRSLWILFR
jgi:CRP-like cAMP-binding protein